MRKEEEDIPDEEIYEQKAQEAIRNVREKNKRKTEATEAGIRAVRQQYEAMRPLFRDDIRMELVPVSELPESIRGSGEGSPGAEPSAGTGTAGPVAV